MHKAIKFQASEQSGSEEEDLNIFYVFLWFEPGTPWGGITLYTGSPFEQTW